MQMWTKRVAGDSEAPSLESRWMWRYPAGRVARCQLLCPPPRGARLSEGVGSPGEQGLGGPAPLLFPPPSAPPTLLQAAERQCKLAHKVIGGRGVIIFHHEPDQHQLRSPQLELQGLPPAGVEA